MAYGVVRTDKLTGTIDGAKLCAFKFYNGENEANIENGAVVALDNYLGQDIWKAVAPVAGQEIGKLVLVDGVELFEDRTHPLEDWINKAGVACRGYILDHADIFSVTAEDLTEVPNLTNKAYIGCKAGTKWEVWEAATKTVDTKTYNAVAELIAVENVGGMVMYVYRVI